ncbi:hypothetical protein QTP86_002658 [Hemibagrus guttatus]|nr:hypothetical protein QTP86_002658 [Hemibagrus guttatus]
MASPLTSLLPGKPKHLKWSIKAREAFVQLKECFTSAPFLTHPDPSHPFIIEVDASSCGIRAALSQCHGNPRKVHPCAFFSWKLSPAESNYDVGNRELLSIKATLEEWRYCLEGAHHPFLVLTDHRNLEYLRNSKRLNPFKCETAKPKHDGHSSSQGSNSRSPTAQVLRMARQMHCLSVMIHSTPLPYLNPSFNPRLKPPSDGTLWKRFSELRIGSLHHQSVPPPSCMSLSHCAPESFNGYTRLPAQATPAFGIP